MYPIVSNIAQKRTKICLSFYFNRWSDASLQPNALCQRTVDKTGGEHGGLLGKNKIRSINTTGLAQQYAVPTQGHTDRNVFSESIFVTRRYCVIASQSRCI